MTENAGASGDQTGSPLVADEVTIDVPAGGRVYVVSDLLLRQAPDDAAEAASTEMARSIDAITGPAVLILNGDTFDLLGEGHLDPMAVLGAHGRLTKALAAFAEGPDRRLVVIPGSRDHCLAWHTPAVRNVQRRMTAEVALAVELSIATGQGTKAVRVEHGSRFDPAYAFDDPRNPGESPLGQHLVSDFLPILRRPGAAWLDGIEHLANADDVSAFVGSRLTYRRVLRRFGWLAVPLLVAVGLMIASVIAHAAGGHHGVGRTLRAWAAGVGLSSAVLLAVVGLVSALWWWSVRDPLSLFTLESISGDEHHPNDPPRAAGHRLVAEGHTGFITGHTRSAELADLGGGFYANAGCATVVVERRPGRFGLLDAFGAVRQTSYLVLEAGPDLRVSLHHQRQPIVSSTTTIERLCTRTCAGASPNVQPGDAGRVATWPGSPPWPDQEAPGLVRTRARRVGALVAAVVGLVDLVSAVTPPVRARLRAVDDLLPLVVSQTAAALVVLAGLALLLLARGLRRGHRTAWVAAIVLLWSSFLLHVVKGLDFEEGLVALVAGLFLLFNQRFFRVKSDEFSRQRASATILGGVGIAVAAGVAAVMLFHGHDPRPSLPHSFLAVVERLIGDTSRHLPERIDDFLSPSLLAASIGLVIAAGWIAFRPVVGQRLAAPAPEAEENARRIVGLYGADTLAYFALRDDKRWFFWGDTVVAYAVTNGVALVSPDPIGPVWEQRRAWFAFREFADEHGWPVAVMGASHDWLPIYHASGMRDMYVGDEAVADVRRFSLEGGKNKGLRQAVNRIAKYGYRMDFFDPTDVPADVEQGLRNLMAGSRRGEVERGFSMTLGRVFDPRDEGLLLAVCFGPDGSPAAFCQYVPAPGVQGYSLDLMRRSEAEHPNGLTDFVVVRTMEHLREQGMVGLGLNFATMRAVLAGERGEGVTPRIEKWFFSKMSDSMQIESLWRYNAKFDPDWVPRYACYESTEHMLASAFALAKAESWWEIPVLGRFFQPRDERDAAAAAKAPVTESTDPGAPVDPAPPSTPAEPSTPVGIR
ncbi:MAG TPA: phosphatidylglycerol lysyltransferase domain-containing protein [Acidimicrobiales bacterium]|nr:phosphatidylglycerol lysyltransferase domain-containing protein [Acidimicrobiales bacterium]